MTESQTSSPTVDENSFDNTGLYIVVAIYFLALITVTVLTVLKERRIRAKATRSAVEGDEEKQHFLAGKDIGFFLLFISTFSTTVSGYSVVGVPGETVLTGFMSLRWFGVYTYPAIVYCMTVPRIRRLSVARDYTSPLAFYKDRFRSAPLHFAVGVLVVLPNIIYVTAQIVSLDTTIESVTKGEVNGQVASGVILLLLLAYEVVGGFAAVALADMVAGIVLLFGFFMMPILLAYYYGGFEGTVPEGCQNEVLDDAGLPLGGVGGGCLAYTRPDLVSYPTKLYTLRALSFVLNNNAYIVNPQILQRLYAASSDDIIRKAQLAFQGIYPLIILPGILVGITAASIPEVASKVFPVGGSPDQAFGLITDVLIDKGGFSMFVSWILLAGSIAAIMSTTGAAVMGISNTIAVDGYEVVRPNASGSSTVNVGRLCSMLTYIIAFIWAQDDAENITELASLQFGLLAQVFPILFLGLYKKSILQLSLILGIGAGLLAIAITDVGIEYEDQYIEPGLWASFANWFVVIVVEGAWTLRPDLFPEWVIKSEWIGEATGAVANVADPQPVFTTLVGESSTSPSKDRPSMAESEASHAEERDSFLEAMHHLDTETDTPVKDPFKQNLLVKSTMGGIAQAGSLQQHLYGTLDSVAIDRIMADTVEPVHTKYAVLLPIIFFLQIFAMPWWKEEGSNEPIINGMPQWTYITMFIYSIVIVCIFLVFKSWVPPKNSAFGAGDILVHDVVVRGDPI